MALAARSRRARRRTRAMRRWRRLTEKQKTRGGGREARAAETLGAEIALEQSAAGPRTPRAQLEARDSPRQVRARRRAPRAAVRVGVAPGCHETGRRRARRARAADAAARKARVRVTRVARDALARWRLWTRARGSGSRGIGADSSEAPGDRRLLSRRWRWIAISDRLELKKNARASTRASRVSRWPLRALCSAATPPPSSRARGSRERRVAFWKRLAFRHSLKENRRRLEGVLRVWGVRARGRLAHSAAEASARSKRRLAEAEIARLRRRVEELLDARVEDDRALGESFTDPEASVEASDSGASALFAMRESRSRRARARERRTRRPCLAVSGIGSPRARRGRCGERSRTNDAPNRIARTRSRRWNGAERTRGRRETRCPTRSERRPRRRGFRFRPAIRIRDTNTSSAAWRRTSSRPRRSSRSSRSRHSRSRASRSSRSACAPSPEARLRGGARVAARRRRRRRRRRRGRARRRGSFDSELAASEASRVSAVEEVKRQAMGDVENASAMMARLTSLAEKAEISARAHRDENEALASQNAEMKTFVTSLEMKVRRAELAVATHEAARERSRRRKRERGERGDAAADARGDARVAQSHDDASARGGPRSRDGKETEPPSKARRSSPRTGWRRSSPRRRRRRRSRRPRPRPRPRRRSARRAPSRSAPSCSA